VVGFENRRNIHPCYCPGAKNFATAPKDCPSAALEQALHGP